jgi:hypothetical protein
VSCLGDGGCTPRLRATESLTWRELGSGPFGFWFGNRMWIGIANEWPGIIPKIVGLPESWDDISIGSRSAVASGLFIDRWEWGRGIAGISRQWALLIPPAGPPAHALQGDRRQNGQVDGSTTTRFPSHSRFPTQFGDQAIFKFQLLINKLAILEPSVGLEVIAMRSVGSCLFNAPACHAHPHSSRCTSCDTNTTTLMLLWSWAVDSMVDRWEQ